MELNILKIKIFGRSQVQLPIAYNLLLDFSKCNTNLNSDLYTIASLVSPKTVIGKNLFIQIKISNYFKQDLNCLFIEQSIYIIFEKFLIDII
jgi:hypothetical protein